MDSFVVSVVIKEKEFAAFGSAVNYVQAVRNLVPDAVIQIVSAPGSTAPVDPENIPPSFDVPVDEGK